MTLRDGLILGFTFFVGLFSGAYLYATEFRPTYIGDRTDLPEAGEEGFSVIGVIYGGFVPPAYEHPSFRIAGNGTYDYFPGGEGEIARQEGELPNRLFKALQDAVASSNLDSYTRSVDGGSCAHFADGIDYEYNIERDSVEYELDTCFTAFSNSTQLGAVLLDVWRYLAAPDEFRFSIQNYPEPDTGQREWSLRGFIESGFEGSGFDSDF